MLQRKVEDALKRAMMQADEMLRQGQADLFSVVHTLDASIEYGDENEAYLTAEARWYKMALHQMRSECMVFLVRIGLLSVGVNARTFQAYVGL